MAEFSVNQTNISEAPNAVTPKQGIVDRATPYLVSEIAEIGKQGYIGYETSQFRQESRAAVAEELGIEFEKGANAKAYRDALDRASQAMALGDTGLVDRVKIRQEVLLRQKMADQPWLSQYYRGVANEVLNDYSAILGALDAQAALARKYAGKDPLEKPRNMVDEGLKRNGIVPMGPDGQPISVWDMDESTLKFYEQHIRLADNQAWAVERLVKLNAEDRAQAGEARAGADYAYRVAEQQKKTLSSQVRTGKVAQFGLTVNEYIGKMLPRISTASATELGTLEEEALVSANTLRQGINQYMKTPEAMAMTEEDQRYLQTELHKRVEDIVGLFTGDANKVQRNARTLQLLKDESGIDLFEASPFLARLGAQGFGPSVITAIVQVEAFKSGDITEEVAKGFGAVINYEQERALKREEVTRDYEDVAGGRTAIEDLPNDRRVTQAKVSMSELFKLAQNPKDLEQQIKEKPDYGSLLSKRLADATTFKIKEKDYSNISRDFLDNVLGNMYPKLSSDEKRKVSNDTRRIAFNMVPYYTNIKRSLKDRPDGELAYDAVKGEFYWDKKVGARGSRGEPKEAIKELNRVLNALVLTSDYDGEFKSAEANRPSDYYFSILDAITE